jgi:hypothetical protein
MLSTSTASLNSLTGEEMTAGKLEKDEDPSWPGKVPPDPYMPSRGMTPEMRTAEALGKIAHPVTQAAMTIMFQRHQFLRSVHGGEFRKPAS